MSTENIAPSSDSVQTSRARKGSVRERGSASRSRSVHERLRSFDRLPALAIDSSMTSSNQYSSFEGDSSSSSNDGWTRIQQNRTSGSGSKSRPGDLVLDESRAGNSDLPKTPSAINPLYAVPETVKREEQKDSTRFLFSSQRASTHQPGHSIGTNALGSRRLRATETSSAFWLLLYFLFNLGLTLFNKVVLQGFPFPYTLTALHALGGTVGTLVAQSRGSFKRATLTFRQECVMIAFSLLYTVNIAVSNVSLGLVSVPVRLSP